MLIKIKRNEMFRAKRVKIFLDIDNIVRICLYVVPTFTYLFNAFNYIYGLMM